MPARGIRPATSLTLRGLSRLAWKARPRYLCSSSTTEFPAADPITLEPGDIVVLVTDGIQEAMSPTGEQFGTERLLEVVRATPHEEGGSNRRESLPCGLRVLPTRETG